MKRGWRILLTVLLVIVVLLAAMFAWVTSGLKSGRELAIGTATPATLADGTYQGVYRGGRWSNTVEVTVKGQKITDIRIVKNELVNVPGVNEQLFARVIEKQMVPVDVVTGSTVSSKAYLKAIENALKSTPR